MNEINDVFEFIEFRNELNEEEIEYLENHSVF